MTVAHAGLADALLVSGVDLVLFVYSVRTLEKEEGPGGVVVPALLSPAARVASLIEYSKGKPGLGVALASHGLYVDQAEAAARRFPGAGLVFAVGSDKVSQLFDPAWYEHRDEALDRLFARARLLYVLREEDEGELDAALEANPRWAGRIDELDVPSGLVSISSRDVRRRASRGVTVASEVPAEVLPFLDRAVSGANRFR